MELTERETRALARLVKIERQWRWYRFVALILGAGIMAVGLWLIHDTQQSLLSTTRNMSFRDSPSGMEVYFASIFGGQLAVANLLPLFGGMIIGFTIGRWRGHPVHTLLIGAMSRGTASAQGAEHER